MRRHSRSGAALGVATTLLLLLLAGCHRPTQAEIKFLETREVNRPYELTYNACLNAMFSMGMTITHTDKHSGVISAQSGDHAQRADAGIWKGFYPVKKVTLMVSPRRPDRTQIRMNVLINEKQKLDRRLMTRIWQRIEREAMLDSGPSRRRR
ncbi:MAG: hypothetical protein JSV78_08250 [Phycisphaerales bacterium]|nr:MAG: hypothetical protein JSV78_08250 [Phycisphaerales bacterium]